MTINDGNGLMDTEGLLAQLVTILNEIEIKGAANAQKLYLVASGILQAKEAVHKEKEQHAQDKKRWEEELREHGVTIERQEV